MSAARRRAALAILIAPLAMLGLLASLGRGWSVIDTLMIPAASRPELSRLDEASIARLETLSGLAPDDELLLEIRDQNQRFLARFNRHPLATLAHVLPAALFMLLAPLQLSRRIRARHPAWHRRSGRVLVFAAVPIALSGFFFGFSVPFAGTPETAAIGLFGCLFLWSAARGFAAIRRRDVARHREWMIRMCAVAFGVSVVRLVGSAIAFVTVTGPEVWFAASLWIGFSVSVLAAEAWIRRTRVARVGLAPATPLPVGRSTA